MMSTTVAHVYSIVSDQTAPYPVQFSQDTLLIACQNPVKTLVSVAPSQLQSSNFFIASAANMHLGTAQHSLRSAIH